MNILPRQKSSVANLSPESLKGVIWGLIVTAALAVLILIGSRRLSHFDVAIFGYMLAVLFSTFGLTYRYVMWLQRPPTALYWRRGWQTFFRRGHRLRNVRNWWGWVIGDFALNRFIWTRDRLRGLTHFLIMWGCIIAVAITFPLVFGWLHFQTVPGQPDWYQIVVFGFPGFTFPTESFVGYLLFHGLVWSAFITIAGVMLALRRRMRDEGAAAVQLFAEDFLPLILLFAVSITGLMLTASYTWMKGYAYTFLANFHAITVIATFLWLPFGKFFHIFQRPAQIGVRFYKDVGEHEEPALCRRCGAPFTSRMHVEDLIKTEAALGYNYAMPGTAAGHYQLICPPCRRALFVQAQGRLWGRESTAVPAPWEAGARPGQDGGSPAEDATAATPVYVNPAHGEGPLGAEDARNFHP